MSFPNAPTATHYYEVIARWIKDAEHIAVMTGAGVSTDAGIPDFKSIDAVWPHAISREEALSHGFMKIYPQAFWGHYWEIFGAKLSAANPTAFHEFIAGLEQNARVSVFTQNIDGLHQQAGSSRVFEVHGNGVHLLCECGERWPAGDFIGDVDPRCRRHVNPFLDPDAQCGKALRPDIVLYGESVRCIPDALASIPQADLLIVAGTSLEVYPFAGLTEYAFLSSNTRTLLINATPTDQDMRFELVLRDRFSMFLDRLGQAQNAI